MPQNCTLRTRTDSQVICDISVGFAFGMCWYDLQTVVFCVRSVTTPSRVVPLCAVWGWTTVSKCHQTVGKKIFIYSVNICSLLIDDFRNSDYLASNGWMRENNKLERFRKEAIMP